jgi:hypothetical protein
MTLWQENIRSDTEEDTENDRIGSSQDMDVDTQKSRLTRKRPEDSREYDPEKNKKTPRTENFGCPKGCGYVGTRARALSQHARACNGKPWDVQKRQKAQTSRSKVQESQSTERSS